MNPFWSQIAHELSPCVPGERPRIANQAKLNTNESPFGPSPLALEAMRSAAADTLRLHPDPEATDLREALAARHGVKPGQVFVAASATPWRSCAVIDKDAPQRGALPAKTKKHEPARGRRSGRQ